MTPPENPPIPDNLLTCPVPGPLPDPDTATQADIAIALVDARTGWEACAAALKGVRVLMKSGESLTKNDAQVIDIHKHS